MFVQVVSSEGSERMTQRDATAKKPVQKSRFGNNKCGRENAQMRWPEDGEGEKALTHSADAGCFLYLMSYLHSLGLVRSG